MTLSEWSEQLPEQRPTRIRNVQPFADLQEIVPSAFMLCVRPSLGTSGVDTGSIGMLACSPELLLGGHELNRALMYVNDLGDEPFEFEGVDNDVITSCYLRTQGVPSRTLELCTSR